MGERWDLSIQLYIRLPRKQSADCWHRVGIKCWHRLLAVLSDIAAEQDEKVAVFDEVEIGRVQPAAGKLAKWGSALVVHYTVQHEEEKKFSASVDAKKDFLAEQEEQQRLVLMYQSAIMRFEKFGCSSRA